MTTDDGSDRACVSVRTITTFYQPNARVAHQRLSPCVCQGYSEITSIDAHIYLTTFIFDERDTLAHP